MILVFRMTSLETRMTILIILQLSKCLPPFPLSPKVAIVMASAAKVTTIV